MLIEYELYGLDETHYKEDIFEFVPIISAELKKFYNKFDIEIEKVKYKSSKWKHEAAVSLETDCPNLYCEIHINIPSKGSGYLAPSKRTWEITFHFKNIDITNRNKLYEEFGLKSLNIYTTKDSETSVTEKLRNAISRHMNWMDSYAEHKKSLDLFLF